MKFRLFNTFEPPGAPIFKDLLPYLAQQGHEITVNVSSISYRPIKSNYFKKEYINKIKYNYLKTITLTKNKYISKLSTMISYSFLVIIHSLFSKKVHKNIFLTQPPLFFLWGFVLLLLKHEKYICVMMDIYPDVAIKGGMIHEEGFIAKVMRLITNFALKHAESVIVIGRCMKKKIEKIGIPSSKIEIVTNWVDENEMNPIPHPLNSFRQKNGLTDKFVIMYSGNMGLGHYFDNILEVAKRLKGKKDIIFLFIGGGLRLNEIKEYKKKIHLNNIKLMPYQSTEIINQSLASADIHFISLREGFEGLIVPSKLYGILAVARPIIFQGSQDSEIALLINEHKVGFAVKLGETNMLESHMLELKDNPELRKSMGEKSRYILEKYYDKESRLNLYKNIFTK